MTAIEKPEIGEVIDSFEALIKKFNLGKIGEGLETAIMVSEGADNISVKKDKKSSRMVTISMHHVGPEVQFWANDEIEGVPMAPLGKGMWKYRIDI